VFENKLIRNIAVIAHIDHGKTTLLDGLLKQAAVFHVHEKIPERVMDSYDQEKERGITIFAKHTSLFYHDYKINLIDTPGHADFSGEVERVLDMVNSVLLLVDAKEGPMPQTRFVLMKALKKGLCPIVVINKIDRPNADPDRALNLTFDLFVKLGANDRQLNFAYCYASGLNGYAFLHLGDPREDLKPLFDLIIQATPAPEGQSSLPFLMQAASVEADDYLGRGAVGRILNGSIKKGMSIWGINKNQQRKPFRIQKIEGYHGLKKVAMEEAGAGDIVTVYGLEEVTIGDTLCQEENQIPLPPISIEEPTLSIDIMVNSGPLSGQDGQHLTMNKIRERLLKEKKANVTLEITLEDSITDKITVSGRGELHLAVLLEAMRREGFEFLVSRPEVILKTIDGQISEPIEMAHLEVPEEFSGTVIEELGRRRGEMQFLEISEHGIAQMDFLIPTRGLVGCRETLLTLTRGLVIMTSIFENYQPFKGPIPGRQNGVLISNCQGQANGYACFALQERGALFVAPGNSVYEGMIVGENARSDDLIVNVTKAKHLTNIRAAGKDENILLTPPRVFTLEQAINFIADDELVEITPKNIRLRKRFLSENERKNQGRKKNKEQTGAN
jgi:GTP-binding protein